VLDRRLVERVAEDLGTSAGLVEKDWHIVRAWRDRAGRSRRHGAGLFRRHFAVERLGADQAVLRRHRLQGGRAAGAERFCRRRARSNCRERILKALISAGFALEGKPEAGNDSRFFAADIGYAAQFGAGWRLRPHIRTELSFRTPAVPAIARPIRSLITATAREPAEVAACPCIDVVETAADKLSALAWRVRVRRRGEHKDDPTMIRHRHDLAAFEAAVAPAANFRELVLGVSRRMWAEEGRRIPPPAPPSSSPACCSGLRPIRFGRESTGIS
jgi:hypothetical protein